MSERDPLQTLWVNQQSESFFMSIEEIRSRSTKLQAIVRRRNFVEYLVGGLLIVIFTAAAVLAASALGKLACALTAVGVAVVLWRLNVLARAASAQDMSIVESWASFYRQELVRQRDALSSIWFWYLGPLMPGMVMFWLSVGVRSGGSSLRDWVVSALGLAATALVFAAVAAANKQAAASLQAEIDAIDQSRGS